MRLTLRTLLAYLDDTLEPAQARLMGQKIAESEQARDLIERIREVTRRRRITTAPDGGPGGKLDPNTLGEYLDNTVSPEQAAEVEEICLTSDTHLADVAACHQILSLILGEPALVPPSATRRMYGLVKGPEAIPFRKPRSTVARVEAEPSEGHDVDDTLRLGMRPVTGRNKGSPWLVITAGASAACLLLIAVWMIISRPERLPEPAKEPPVVVQIDPNQDKAPPPIEPSKDKVDVPPETKKEPEGKKVETKDPLEIKLPPVVIDVPWSPADPAIRPLGQVVHDPKEPGILLHYVADKMEWWRLGPKNPEVTSGRPLVSLPSARSVIQLDKGLQLTLVGKMYPELFYTFPLYESAVELHPHEQLDLDLTLRRGRIRVAAGERPARIRVRFDNPTQPNPAEHFDITLQSAGTEVLVDRWFYPTPEKFFRDPKDVNRVGPSAFMACVVLQGSVLLRSHDVAVALTAPPGPGLVAWNSFKGLDKPVEMKALPDGLKAPPPLPMGMDPRMRTDLLRARDDLQQRLLVKAVDVTLAESLKATDPVLRRLAVCSLGALDEISTLIEQLEQEAAPEMRPTAIHALRHWIAAARDNDYKLLDQLKGKYKTAEAETIITLLHGFDEKAWMTPDTYDLLINYLNHSQLALRELAAWQLYQQVPEGQKIKYSASADPATRLQAQTAWRTLIPTGQLPPMPMKK